MKKRRNSNHKQPTMHDVARLAGVSQPTVSRVLNQSSTTVQISDETRERVYAAVRQLGYRPNVIARSLRTQRTQMIALLIGDIENAFYHSIVRAIQDTARQRDFEVLVTYSDHRYENELHFCDIVSRRPIDGVIMAPVHLTVEDLDRFMSKTHMPVAVLGHHVQHPDMDVVYVDDERATYEATQWLIKDRGYRNFGFVGVSEDLPPGPRRFRGFKRALDEAGLKLHPRFVLQGDFTMESGTKAAQALLRMQPRPEALVVINDMMAIGLILALQEAGVQVPDDVAVIGFDDIPAATIVRPTLTTIAQDSHGIGEKLSQALFERIDDPNIHGRRTFECAFRIVPRQSA